MKKIQCLLLSFMFFVSIESAEPFSIMQKCDLEQKELAPASRRFVLSMYNDCHIKMVPDIAKADFWKEEVVQKNVGLFTIGAGNLFLVLRDMHNQHKVCGLARFGIFNRYAQIHQLVIDEHYRGHGLGSVLLGEIQKIALGFDKRFLQLAVYDSNSLAIEFYEKHGFACI